MIKNVTSFISKWMVKILLFPLILLINPPKPEITDEDGNTWVTAKAEKWTIKEAIEGVRWIQLIKKNKLGIWCRVKVWKRN